MSRKTAREMTLKLLYQLEIQKDDEEEQLKYFLEENNFSGKDRDFVVDVVNGIRENTAYIDSFIEKYAKGWSLKRISKIDLAILRLAVYELTKRDDIPPKVSANEAVELAKRYSSDEAKAFINGILREVIAEVEKKKEEK